MQKAFSRKNSDNSLLKPRPNKSPIAKENQFRYPDILRRKDSKPLQVQTNQTEMRSDNVRSPSAMSNLTQSPINKSVLITHRSQSMFQDAQYIDYIITNKEVSAFLKKHFLHEQCNTNQRPQSKLICDSWDRVPIAYFLKALFSEYPEVVEEHQLNEKLMMKLRQLIKDLVSEDGQLVSLNKLQIHTKQLGLLGLLLTALREIQEVGRARVDSQVQNHNHTATLEAKANEMVSRVESKLTQNMSKLNLKQQQIEKLLTQFKQKVSDNFDLFQHEAQNKAVITNLRQQLKLREQQIHDLETKIRQTQIHQSTEEDSKTGPRVSPVRVTSPINSPFSDNQALFQKLTQGVCKAWDMSSNTEDYRFAQVLLAAETNQMPFQHLQLIPTIKAMPGFSEFVSRNQSNMHLITAWVQNMLQSDQCYLLELYMDIIALIPSLKTSDQETYIQQLLILFLKLTTTIYQIKCSFNPQRLKEWLQQLGRKHPEQQLQFLSNLVAQITLIGQFAIKAIPQNKYWSKLIQDKEYPQDYSPLIENPLVNQTIKKFLASVSSKLKYPVSLYGALLNCYYSNTPEECVKLMHSVQEEKESDLLLSRLLLESDVVNLILLPSIRNSKYCLRVLTALLSFKCPGQFYILYTRQVCAKQNIEQLTELLTQLHNTSQQDVVQKIWEMLGAIAKSVCLKSSKENLSFVIRLYSNQAAYQQSIALVQKNLVS